jgi:multiple sugar transport system substrate-binding protein
MTVATVACVVGATACASSASSANSVKSGHTAKAGCPTSVTTTLTEYDYATGADPKAKPMAQALANFQKMCPNITVQRTTAPDPDTLMTKYETSLLAGQEPDVIFSNLVDKSVSWEKDHATIPVTKLIHQWGLKFNRGALSQWKAADGQIQAFPFEGFSWPIFYNKAIFAKAGVHKLPTTTDELIADAAKIRSAGYQPMAIGGSDWTGNKLLTEVVETKVPDQEMIQAFKTGNWNKPAIKAGLQLFVKLRDGGVFADSAQGLTVNNMDTMYYGGKAAMMDNGSWAYAGTPKQVARQTVLGGFPLPSGSIRQSPVVLNGYTSTGFWISPNGEKNLAAVKAFITYFYQPKVLASFVQQAAILPGTAESVAQLPVNKKELDPLFLQASKLVPKTTPVALWDTYVPAAASAGFVRATSEAYTPGTSVSQIISDIKQAYTS